MITLCCVRRSDRLSDSGDLIARTNDLLPTRVADKRNILILPLSPLPDLNFASAADDTDAHGGEKVVSGVGVVVDTTIEDGGCVFADSRGDESLSTRMFLDEVGNIVNDTCDGNESSAVLSLGLVVVPVDDGELLERNTPVESLTLLIKLLLELLETTLLNLVLLELLQVEGEAHLLPDPDGPLCGIILMPLDGITVVGGELVMEVVVTFAKGNESSDYMITRRIAVIERLVSEPVSKGVDAEGGLLNEEDSENSCVDETSHPVSPSEASDKARENHAHEDDGLDVVSVLPDDDWVIVQI